MLSINQESDRESRQLLEPLSSVSEPLASKSFNESIAKQLVDMELLYLLSFSPRSGYELRKQLLSLFKIRISYGTLYPHLHSLEKAGLISGAWQQKFDEAPLKKRLYSLTPAGTESLRTGARGLSRIALAMQFMITQVDSGLKVKESTIEDPESVTAALNLIEGFFSRRGYVVRKTSNIRGLSGRDHVVDLFATIQGSKPSGSPSFVLNLVQMKNVSMGDVMKLQVVAFDLDAKPIIVSSSPLPEEVRRTVDFYGIQVFTGKSCQEAASALCSSLKI